MGVHLPTSPVTVVANLKADDAGKPVVSTTEVTANQKGKPDAKLTINSDGSADVTLTGKPQREQLPSGSVITTAIPTSGCSIPAESQAAKEAQEYVKHHPLRGKTPQQALDGLNYPAAALQTAIKESAGVLLNETNLFALHPVSKIEALCIAPGAVPKNTQTPPKGKTP